jgi:hypothetical protein
LAWYLSNQRMSRTTLPITQPTTRLSSSDSCTMVP